MIHVGNCLDILPTLEADSFDSIVTDPPYGLGFMGKEWDDPARRGDIAMRRNPAMDAVNTGASKQGGRQRAGLDYQRRQARDAREFEAWCEQWALEALRVAKPGAYLAAFGGTRMFHRLIAGIEDAGWEIRDTLMWVYGSGFPKSHNGEWGGTALKPAWEPIVLARKPLMGTVAKNHARHGTGGLNIDGCRIEGADKTPAPVGQFVGSEVGPTGLRGERNGSSDHLGRWPANLVHDGSEDVLAAFPDAPGQQADLTGDEPSRPFKNAYGVMDGRRLAQARIDTGSAARFFYCAKASRQDRNEGCEAFAAKPLNWSSGDANPGSFQGEGTDKTARNNHPTVKPTDLMRWLCRLVTPPGGHVLDPFTGSGSTGRGASLEGFQFTGIELSGEYAAIAEARIRAAQPGLALEHTA